MRTGGARATVEPSLGPSFATLEAQGLWRAYALGLGGEGCIALTAAEGPARHASKAGGEWSVRTHSLPKNTHTE